MPVKTNDSALSLNFDLSHNVILSLILDPNHLVPVKTNDSVLSAIRFLQTRGQIKAENISSRKIYDASSYLQAFMPKVAFS